jgi:hypothetical protein
MDVANLGLCLPLGTSHAHDGAFPIELQQCVVSLGSDLPPIRLNPIYLNPNMPVLSWVCSSEKYMIVLHCDVDSNCW